jgi:Rap1a immunity proteins
MAVVAISFAGTTHAEEKVMPFYLTGENFLALCQERQSECLAYVIGVVDLALALSATFSDSLPICLPETLEPSDLVRVAVASVEVLEDRQRSPSGDIASAIAAQFPCS